MYKIKKQFIMLIFFLFVIIAFINTVSADQSIIYVNDSGGNDSWNGEATTWDGSTLLGPKKSIKNATGTVTSGGIVNIANGVYNGTGNTNIAIDKNMAIIGESQSGTIINAQNAGQIFNIQNNVTIALLNLTLTNENSGNSAIFNTGNCIINYCTFTCNGANSVNGGAIHTEDGNLVVINSDFINSYASRGGAIFNSGLWGNITIDGCNFINNSADWYGGVICSYNGILSVNNSTFINNTATQKGGAICSVSYAPGKILTLIYNSSFIGNAANHGGAVFNEGVYYGTGYSIGDNELIMNFCQIVGNTPEDISNNNEIPADLRYNWWGLNNWWGSNNHLVSDRVFGNSTLTPWLVLTLNANSITLVNGTSLIVADLLHDSSDIYHNPAYGHIPDGIPLNFTTTLGTITNTVATVNGTAIATLNGGPVSGIANVSVKLDNQTLQKPINVYDTVTVDQIKQAASTVRNYIETQRKLPNTVQIGSYNVTMPQFLELLTTALLQINSNANDLIYLRNFSAPINPTENIHSGNIYKSEYMKLASDIKNYMDSTGKTPDYAYGTSIGPKLRFENIVYMYAMILDYHRTSGNIAGWAAMEPWSVITSKPFVDPNAPKFTVAQIEIAASTLRTYVETYHKLPNTIQVGSTDVSMSQFLELLTTTLLQINNGNNNQISLRNFTDPVNPKEDIHTGNIYKSEYMKLASDIKNYMDSTGKTPGYAYGTSIGSYLRFENLVYMYAMILDYHRTSGNIAGWAAMEPWSYITSKPVIDPNAPKFTVAQIENAASTLRTYVETYHNLPNTIQVGSTDVSMSQFLELLTTSLLQINSGNNNQIILRNFTDPVNPKENIHTGNMYKSEYMKLAGDIKNYMDSSGKSPGYAYGTSIGPYLRFESLVYMYAMILDYHRTSGNIAGWAEMEPWSDITSRPVIDLNAPKFSIYQIKVAAFSVVDNVENAHNLPDKVTINGIDVSMPQFLELLTTALLQINNGNNNLILLRNFTAPVNPVEDINIGFIPKAEYMKLANDIKNYMDSTGKTPDYVYGTSIGPKLRFENIVYMYALILNNYNNKGIMVEWVGMGPWDDIVSLPFIDPNAPKFTIDQVKIAASTVRHQIETNHKLPQFVTINGIDVKIPQFLELLTTSLLQICMGNNSAMPLMNFTAPINPKEEIYPGDIYIEDYVNMAVDIKYYMDTKGKAPDYAYGTSIGPYLRYENLVYMYTMILDYYNTSGRLADWAAMKPWAMI